MTISVIVENVQKKKTSGKQDIVSVRGIAFLTAMM